MARNPSGTYTLPAGNPVTVGTVIEANWANTTLSDIANELTNSLSRNGQGGMLAPFRLADGTVTAPGLAFLNETNTGIYRAASGEMWLAVNGVAVAQFTVNGMLIPTGRRLSLPAPVNGTDATTKTYVDDRVDPVIQYANYYLGPKSSDPTLNNSGGALVAGTTYWSTTLNQLRFYNGTNWVPSPTISSLVGQTFSGTGAQTAFTLANPTGNAINLEVFISGVRQVPTTNYTVSGTTLTFLVAPPSGTDNIFVRYAQLGNITDGAGSIVYTPSGTGAVATNVQSKLREFVSVKDFGAVGDGVADDTVAIQAAINTEAKEIIFPAGSTYLIDGGLVSNTEGQIFRAYGATIRLKNNATVKGMLRLNGAGSSVLGGTWDGNKANGNGGPTSGSSLPVEVYASWNINISANRCTIKDCYSINTYGMFCTGGSVSDTLFQDNTVRNTVGYGIFLSSAVDAYRNRAIGNNIDMSEGVVWGQGILFTRTGSVLQYDWELSSNTIIGSQDAGIADLAINLAVRGAKGIVSNNVTRYGAMGFSEGGADTVITGNSFLDLVGSVRYGIEVSGARTTVSGNTVSNALQGVVVSGNINYDSLCITGNRIQSAENGIRLQIASGYTGRNISITGNNITASLRGIYAFRDIQNLTVSGNTIVGPGSGVNGSRGLYIENPPADAFVFLQGNTIVGFQRSQAIFSSTALAINKLYAIGNNIANDTTSSSRSWNFEGSATMGSDVMIAWGPTNAGLRDNRLDGNLSFLISTGDPEGVFTAGPGSIYLKTNHAFNQGALFIKQTGTGNTGWAAPGESRSASAAEIVAIGNSVNTSGKYAGRLVWDTTNNRMMRASGSTAGSVWWVIDGSASVTPV
jgi:hypothetical protein